LDRPHRGLLLTALAVLFALAAIQDLLKPLHLEGPTTGLVFLGTRLSGSANLVMSVVLAIFLASYAVGIWRMNKYALTLGFIYALYVLFNLVIFSIKYAGEDSGSPAFLIGFIISAIAIPWVSVLLLWRRRHELV
jgi:hypothetical protein